jgi:hypothetical protein
MKLHQKGLAGMALMLGLGHCVSEVGSQPSFVVRQPDGGADGGVVSDAGALDSGALDSGALDSGVTMMDSGASDGFVPPKPGTTYVVPDIAPEGWRDICGEDDGWSFCEDFDSNNLSANWDLFGSASTRVSGGRLFLPGGQRFASKTAAPLDAVGFYLSALPFVTERAEMTTGGAPIQVVNKPFVMFQLRQFSIRGAFVQSAGKPELVLLVVVEGKEAVNHRIELTASGAGYFFWFLHSQESGGRFAMYANGARGVSSKARDGWFSSLADPKQDAITFDNPGPSTVEIDTIRVR